MKQQPGSLPESGQILIFAFVFMIIVTIIVGALVSYAVVQIKSHRQAVNREVGLDIAEAGVEAAIYKLNNQSGYAGENNTPYNNGVYTVTLTALNNSNKLVKVDSYIPNAINPIAHRIVQVKVTVGVKNFGFNYGVQVGIGGLVMDNNSTVIGNVYGNGNLVGCNNGCSVTGDVIVGGATGSISKVSILGNSKSHTITSSSVSGNADHYALVSTQVTKDASVHSLNGPSCSIGGKAKYDTKVNCNVTGATTTPNPSVPADPPVQALPVDDAQVAAWEAEAAGGGSMNGTTINGNVTLGPKKINGDLTVNGVLTMTGTLWVTGNLTMNNGSTVKLDPSFGPLGGEVVVGTSGTTVNGYININQGANAIGSGTAGSYVMLLSERDTTANSNVAITVGNNVNGAILYSNHGLVEVINRALLKEITAWKLHLNNETDVTYDTGYASAEFSSGPSGGWQVADQTYQLLR